VHFLFLGNYLNLVKIVVGSLLANLGRWHNYVLFRHEPRLRKWSQIKRLVWLIIILELHNLQQLAIIYLLEVVVFGLISS
jgi:hypothetical protein